MVPAGNYYYPKLAEIELVFGTIAFNLLLFSFYYDMF